MAQITFADHIAAIVYMEDTTEEESRTIAWMEGPLTGHYRTKFAQAHQKHAIALESGDGIDPAWEEYRLAQNNWVFHYATGENPENVTIG